MKMASARMVCLATMAASGPSRHVRRPRACRWKWTADVGRGKRQAVVALVGVPSDSILPAQFGKYRDVDKPSREEGISFGDLPGFTRTVYERDHALVTPESRVWTGLQGWINTIGAYYVSPAMMSTHFTMYMARMGNHSATGLPPPGVERFVFVIEGLVEIRVGEQIIPLQEDHYAYFPADFVHSITSETGALLHINERKYSNAEISQGEKKPQFLHGVTDEQPVLPVPGEVFVLRKLLPQTSEYDFNIHVMDFQPGEFLNVKEFHYNQHSLLLLQGQGVYRLGEKWYPVQAGDVIWMGAFVPQWYCALGKQASRYILYKDTNRDPLHEYGKALHGGIL